MVEPTILPVVRIERPNPLLRMQRALQECAAAYTSPEGTAEECAQHLAREFQRRMNVAAAALADGQFGHDK